MIRKIFKEEEVKKIVLALAFLSSFMLVSDAKEPTIEELISGAKKYVKAAKISPIKMEP